MWEFFLKKEHSMLYSIFVGLVGYAIGQGKLDSWWYLIPYVLIVIIIVILERIYEDWNEN
ncbi:hypothetical protein C121_34 [Stenotrophomonas phage C121]|uniref:hypothetical protein n=1 Tax=Stenotrophomonas phage C121 TaxID=2914029 RepID=UPI0023298469|nr:hypothetical protein PP752_gp34 [Stenotrophomonas phage C121]UKL14767.1 hypothetical protein C121_34 [Stenotrophomonas phage C121]